MKVLLYRMFIRVAGCISTAGMVTLSAFGFTGPNGIVAPTGTNPTTGLPWAPGDTYHLVFVTSNTTQAVSASIADYDTFVNAEADRSTLTGVAAATWYAIGSTASPIINAKDHAVVSAPVYRLDGVLVATSYADMWDASIQNSINKDQYIKTVSTTVWTGTGTDGKYIATRSLGDAFVRYGSSSVANGTWIAVANMAPKTDYKPMYALSQLLTIQAAAPDTPTSPQPTNNAVDVAVSTAMSWTSAGSTGFTLGLWPDGGATNTVSGPLMSWNPGGLQYATTYHWQVVATNSSGAATGAVWTFTTRAAIAPDVPVSLAPTNGAVNLSAATNLSWRAANGTDGYEVYLWVTSVGEPSSPSVTTNATRWDPPGDLLADTAYSWKVVATNLYGSTTGAVWTFTTVPVMPGTPTLIAPTNGAPAEPASSSLSWTSAARATGYEVYLWTDGQTEPVSPSTTTATAAWYPGGLQYSTMYHWKVTATNAYGKTTDGPRTFTTAAAPVAPKGLLMPTGINPATGLNWGPGDKYHLVFVTRGTTQATSSNIADYDRFVNTEAQRSGSRVAGYAVTWFVIGSTLATNAADHAFVSAPVYRLDSVLVATNKTDLWDSSLGAEINKDQYASTYTPSVWTGSTPAGLVNSARAFGISPTRYGSAGLLTSAWIDAQNHADFTEYRALYALSEPLSIPYPAGTLILIF